MYTIESIASELGVSRHTIYGWRKKGVFPPPIHGRRFARYTDKHLRIGRFILKEVHDSRVTLADLAERFAYAESKKRGEND